MNFRVLNFLFSTVAVLGLASTLGCSKVAPDISSLELGKTASTEPPSIFVTNPPTTLSKDTSFDFAFTGANVDGYRVKCGPAASTDCMDQTGYSDWKPLGQTWHADLGDAAAFPDGEMRLCVFARDSSGVATDEIKPTHVDWTKDTVAPTPTLNALTPTSVPGTVTANVGSVNIGDVLTIYQDANCAAAPSAAATSLGSTADVSVALLTDGAYDLYVTAKDKAGNVSACVGPVSYSYDTTAPTLATIAGVYSTAGQYDIEPDDILGESTQGTVRATLASDVVKIEVGVFTRALPNGAALCETSLVYNAAPGTVSVDMNCDGHYTWVQGQEYTVRVKSFDAAGNASTATKDFTFDYSDPGLPTNIGISGGSDSTPNEYYTNFSSSGVHTFKVSYTEPSRVSTDSIAVTDGANTCITGVYDSVASGTDRVVDVSNCAASPEGPASLQITVKSRNGHSSHANFPFIIDRTPPAGASDLKVTGGSDSTPDQILAADSSPVFDFTGAGDAIKFNVSVVDTSMTTRCSAITVTAPPVSMPANCLLTNGAYYAKIESFDQAALMSSVTLPFTVAVPGTVSIDGITGLAGAYLPADTVSDAYLTSDGTVEIHWTYGGGATSQVSIGIDGANSLVAAGGWSAGARIDTTSATGLSDGPHYATISYSDASGLRSLRLDFTVDKIPPTIVLSAMSLADVRSATNTQFDVVISGATSYPIDSSFFTLYQAGTAVCDPIAVSSVSVGVYRMKVSNCTGNGTGLKVGIAAGAGRDDAGNVTPAIMSSTFNVDNIGPTVGAYWNQARTFGDPIATWSTMATDVTSQTLQLYNDYVGGGSMTPYNLPAGDRTKTFAGLPEGKYSFAVVMRDAAGNEGMTAFADVLVDRTPPAYATSFALAGGSPSISATNSFSFTWTKSTSTTDLYDQKLRVFSNATCSAQVAESAGLGKLATNGSLSLPNPNVSYYVALISYDQTGNASMTNECLQVTYDNAPPTMTTPVWSGINRQKTNPTLTWTRSADVVATTVNVYSGSGCTGVPSTVSVGTATSAVLTVADGTYSATVSVIDEAGNPATSACTSSAMTIDRVAPTSSGFHLTSAATTNNPVVAVAWTHSTDSDFAYQNVIVYSDGACGVPVAPKYAAGYADSSLSVSISSLGNGTHSLRLETMDDLENASYSSCMQVTYDTAGPAPPTGLGWNQESPSSSLSVQAWWTPSAPASDLASQTIEFFTADSCGGMGTAPVSLTNSVSSYAYTGTAGAAASYKITSFDALGNATSLCSSTLTFSSFALSNLTLAPSSDADDGVAYFDANGNLVYGADGNQASVVGQKVASNSTTTNAYGYIRFTVPLSGIPADAKITGAVLKLQGDGSHSWTGSDAALRIRAEAVSDATQVGSPNRYPGAVSSAKMTMATMRWPASGQLSWSSNSVNSSVDLSPIIQELVDRHGAFASGSHIQLWIGMDKVVSGVARDVSYNGYGMGTSTIPKLELSYTTTSYYGTGADGSLSVSSGGTTTSLTVASSTKRLSAVRRIKGYVVSGSNLTLTLDSTYATNPISDFAVGDEVMWHVVSSSTGSSCRTDVGRYGFAKVTSVVGAASSTIVIEKAEFPTTVMSGDLTYANSCAMQLVRVPQLTNLTISSTINVPAMTPGSGNGGIFVARVNNTFSFTGGSGAISAASCGFAGGVIQTSGGGLTAMMDTGSLISISTGGAPSMGGGNASFGGAGVNNDSYWGAASARVGCAGVENGLSCLPSTRLFHGGGGGGSYGTDGSYGGNGGGIILIFAKALSGSGTLNAAGGNGFNGGRFAAGGGAGGTIRVVSDNLAGTIVYRVNGGDGGGTDGNAGDIGGGGGGAGYLSRIITNPARSMPALNASTGYVYPGGGGYGGLGGGMDGYAGGASVDGETFWARIAALLPF